MCEHCERQKKHAEILHSTFQGMRQAARVTGNRVVEVAANALMTITNLPDGDNPTPAEVTAMGEALTPEERTDLVEFLALFYEITQRTAGGAIRLKAHVGDTDHPAMAAINGIQKMIDKLSATLGGAHGAEQTTEEMLGELREAGGPDAALAGDPPPDGAGLTVDPAELAAKFDALFAAPHKPGAKRRLDLN